MLHCMNEIKKSVPQYIKVKADAREARIAAAKAPTPPSPASSGARNLVRELVELSKLYRDGDLTLKEFRLAKARLLE
mgnify:CR=1 FL=1